MSPRRARAFALAAPLLLLVPPAATATYQPGIDDVPQRELAATGVPGDHGSWTFRVAVDQQARLHLHAGVAGEATTRATLIVVQRDTGHVLETSRELEPAATCAGPVALRARTTLAPDAMGEAPRCGPQPYALQDNSLLVLRPATYRVTLVTAAPGATALNWSLTAPRNPDGSLGARLLAEHAGTAVSFLTEEDFQPAAHARAWAAADARLTLAGGRAYRIDHALYATLAYSDDGADGAGTLTAVPPEGAPRACPCDLADPLRGEWRFEASAARAGLRAGLWALVADVAAPS